MAHPEALLLSALINTGDVLGAEEQGITPAHFHEFRNEYEWLIEYKVKYRSEPSYSAFKSQFPDFHLFEHTDVSYGLDLVSKAHIRYQLTKLLRQSTTDLKNTSVNPEEVVADLQNETLRISNGIDSGVFMSNSIVDYSSSLDHALLREMEDTYPGIHWYHPSLRGRAEGQQGGDLTVFAARLNQGKSWLLVNEAAQAVLAGKKVLYFSLEMSKRAMEYRFQTIFARHYIKRFTHSMLDKGRGLDLLEYKQFLQFLSENVPGELFINDTSRGLVTPNTVAAQTNKYNPDLVIVDYLSLMGASIGGRSSEWQNIAAISGDLKHIATAFATPVLTASQINREGDTSGWRPPSTKNLSLSDAIGQDSDNVITMKRFGTGAMVYSLEKARSSQAGLLWWSTFDPEHGNFSEITRDEAESIRAQEEYTEDDRF